MSSRINLAIDLCGYLFYVPVGLAVGRLPSCNGTGGTLLYDTTVNCKGGPHALVTLYTTLIYFGFAVIYPYTVYQRIYKGILYDRPGDHETYIQGIEIETMMGLSKVQRDRGRLDDTDEGRRPC